MLFDTRRLSFRVALFALSGGFALLLSTMSAMAGTATIAVAANFTDAAQELGALFEKETGDKVVFSFGSTGQLYAQISQGAPFDAFLAADNQRAKVAVQAGYAVPGTDFTYATGRIVLFSIDVALVNGESTLEKGGFEKLAIANPATAPYGAAAVQTLKALGVYDALAGRLVQGQNIGQTYQFVATGNAQLGFVALSHVIGTSAGSRWLVPQNLYEPIAQDAVLLTHGAENPVARAFLTFLRGPKANAVKEKFGYGTGGQ